LLLFVRSFLLRVLLLILHCCHQGPQRKPAPGARAILDSLISSTRPANLRQYEPIVVLLMKRWCCGRSDSVAAYLVTVLLPTK
jgi:hypothetical protein